MIDGEFLSSNELAEISGCKLPSGQRDWLDHNGWKYVLNAANRPIVGRYFARLQLERECL
jgi:ferritin-like protein